MSPSSCVSSIAGLVSLLPLQFTADHRPTVLFALFMSAMLKDNNPACHAQPKGRAEELGQLASTRFGPAFEADAGPRCVARFGRVSGAREDSGWWNRVEWVSCLVVSSIHLKVMPDSIGTRGGNIDFVPIDVLANVLVETVFNHASKLVAGGERHQGAGSFFTLSIHKIFIMRFCFPKSYLPCRELPKSQWLLNQVRQKTGSRW